MRFRASLFSTSLVLSVIFVSNPGYSEEKVTPGFNPDTSVNFLTLFQRDNLSGNDRTQSPHNGFQLQEAEVQFFSQVDPYFSANALFSIAQKAGGTEFGISPEEVFVETTSLPVATLKLGKFKAAFGKHNTLHTHAYPFIDAPLINQDLFTDEGLNEAGASASFLVPTPWFTELTLQGIGTNNESFLNPPRSGEIAQLASLRNLWDLSDSTTVEWSLYGIHGKNASSRSSNAYGTDLILKWRPEEGGKYHAFIFASEYLNGLLDKADPANPGSFARQRLGGVASWVQLQFAERWWIQARLEHEGIPHSIAFPIKRKQSALLAFNLSEFSSLRVQGDHLLTDGIVPQEYRVSLQCNITIGAHPAHTY